MKYVDPNGQKRVTLNGSYGTWAHTAISLYLEPKLRRIGANEIRLNREVYFHGIIVSDRRPDIAAYYPSGLIEVYEIKQGGCWGLNGSKFENGLEYLQGYIDLIPGSVAGTSLEKYYKVPFPVLGENAYLDIYTYPEAAPGMIYYFADDGRKSERTEKAKSAVLVALMILWLLSGGTSPMPVPAPA